MRFERIGRNFAGDIFRYTSRKNIDNSNNIDDDDDDGCDGDGGGGGDGDGDATLNRCVFKLFL